MGRSLRTPRRGGKEPLEESKRGCLPVQRWHPLPRWFRSAATLPGAVLLETAKFDAENFRSFVFSEPTVELTARNDEEISGVFDAIDEHLQQGSYVAGFVSYECGLALNGISRLDAAASQEVPLLRMGVFRSPTVFDHRTGLVTGTQPSDSTVEKTQAAEVCQAELQIEWSDYERRIRTVQEYLAAGHSYQINFTDRVSGDFTGTPLCLYEQVLSQQPVSYAAFLSLGAQQVLSFSPELFYRIHGGRIQVRPMKGTWPRGRNNTEDDHAARSLKQDEKNRAEHTTIVDLLRNDLGRVCKLGSVSVDTLMRVERYSTLFQMTSDISGTLQPDRTPGEVFQHLFPSGSITGAPKRRTMEIIQETERRARGVYTGAIGYLGPHGSACFNVAIRTLFVEGRSFELGVGGGITADSTAAAEYEECKLKASFLTRRNPDFYLFETMRALGGRIPRLEAHLRRLQHSAHYFGFPYDEGAIQQGLSASILEVATAEIRVRLLLEHSGKWSIETFPLESVPWSGKVLLWPECVQSSNAFLQHKTSNRELYRRALLDAQRQGFDEVLFTNEEGWVTEGAISNLVVSLGQRIVTPDTACGLLPGVERDHILNSRPHSTAGKVHVADLCRAEGIWMCNALRGIRPVSLICDSHGEILCRLDDQGVGSVLPL